jgi:LPXTG-motif cell wall-anchored protein
MSHSWFPTNGAIQRILSTAVAMLLTFTVVVAVPGLTAPADAGTASVNLDQCANGSTASRATPCTWQNGNLNTSNAHLIEGYSVPYRAIMEDLPTGTPVTIILGYDIKASGKHALDYVTSYERYNPHLGFGHPAETVDPTSGVTGLSATEATFPIPAPSSSGSPVAGQPTTDFNSLPASERLFSMFGGTITGISYASEGDLSTGGSAESQISITFTADSETAVLAWGGHIAKASVWGDGNSAGGVSGSSYHMRLLDWTLNNLGNQDRSLKADAVFPTGKVIIHKEAVGGSATFDYVASGTGMSSFSLDTAQSTTKVFDGILAGDGHSTKTVTENLDTMPAGWSFSGLRCSEDRDQNTTTSGPAAHIELDANETVECWYVNKLAPTLELVKKVTNDNGGLTPATAWTLTASGTSGGFSEQATGTSGEASVGPKTVTAGVTYTLSESNPGGYAPSGWSCNGATLTGNNNDQVTLAAGDTATCTITNNDIAPTLELVKKVTNDNGGSAPATAWTLAAAGSSSGFSEQATGTAAEASVGPKTVRANVVYTLSETGPSGYAPSGWSCNGATLTGNNNDQVTLAAGDTATCTITNNDARASIDIEKATNGADADSAPGPYIHVGDAVDWTYVVTNTGDTALGDISVVDNKGVVVTCPASTLAVGASMSCTASGSATPGQYENVGSVTASAETGAPVSDSDPSHYMGVEGDLDIEKHTNTVDADTPTGPYVHVGDTVTWDFIVTNGGNTTVTGIVVEDDLLGVIGCPSTSLAAGASMTCTTSGTATPGQYANVGTVTGTDAAGDQIGDLDPSHYFGSDPAIDITKDVAPGTILGGEATEVTWTIMVANTGNVSLHDVAVTDTLVPDCDLTIGDLAIAGSSTHTCTSTLTPDVPAWTFTNVAVATGVGPGGTPVTAQDDAMVVPVFIAASATIGDTVWSDENENAIQDNGEKGIAGAVVKLTLPDGTTAEAITNSNGLYLFSALEAGQYTVTVDMSSIPAPTDGSNKLTTAGSFTIDLADGQSYLDADFGIAATLPKTGLSSDSLAFAAVALLVAGGLALLGTRRREDDGETGFTG